MSRNCKCKLVEETNVEEINNKDNDNKNSKIKLIRKMIRRRIIIIIKTIINEYFS
jgi:hypothetical protein